MVGISAQKCVDTFICHWVSWAGCQKHLFTDRDTQITSSLWGQMCKFLECQIYYSTAYCPGFSGKIYRTLKSSPKCHENPLEWYDLLPWVLHVLRNSPKEDLAHDSPNSIVFEEYNKPLVISLQIQ